MKKIILFMFMILFAVSFVSALNVRMYSYDTSPSEFVIVIFNHGDKIRDAKVSAAMPELDIRTSSETFDLGTDKSNRLYLETDLSVNAESDYYPVHVTISDKYGVQWKTHTWLLIE